jgi:hypothetical protein
MGNKAKTVMETITLVGLLARVLSMVKYILDKVGNWKGARKIKKKYRDGKNAVGDGNIDAINEILK